MLKNVEAVIFDLDGTLVDSMWMWKSIDQEYLSTFDQVVPEGLEKLVEGMSFSETAAYFKEEFSIPDPVEKIKHDWNNMAKLKYMHEVPMKKGSIEFLQYLRKNEIKTGIATSNSIELVKIIMEAHDINQYFDSVHTSCEVEKGKPAPDIYQLVAKELEVLPERCLVFEDIISGIMAGKNAGMKVCAVYDEYSKAYDDKKIELSDYYIQGFDELNI